MMQENRIHIPIISVYDTIEGFYSYTSVAGYNLTVPKVIAEYIVK